MLGVSRAIGAILTMCWVEDRCVSGMEILEMQRILGYSYVDLETRRQDEMEWKKRSTAGGGLSTFSCLWARRWASYWQYAVVWPCQGQRIIQARDRGHDRATTWGKLRRLVSKRHHSLTACLVGPVFLPWRQPWRPQTDQTEAKDIAKCIGGNGMPNPENLSRQTRRPEERCPQRRFNRSDNLMILPT